MNISESSLLSLFVFVALTYEKTVLLFLLHFFLLHFHAIETQLFNNYKHTREIHPTVDREIIHAYPW